MHLPELVDEDLSLIHTAVLHRSLVQYASLQDALNASRLPAQTSLKTRISEARERISKELLRRGVDLSAPRPPR